MAGDSTRVELRDWALGGSKSSLDIGGGNCWGGRKFCGRVLLEVILVGGEEDMLGETLVFTLKTCEIGACCCGI